MADNKFMTSGFQVVPDAPRLPARVAPQQRTERQPTMPTVHDVAAHILGKLGTMSTMKLQKLCYYAQAWSLVWDERPLFLEPIQAWANGPVAPALYQAHRGKFSVTTLSRGDATNLNDDERETVDAVIRDYGHLTGRQLSHITHQEDPWRVARAGLGPTDPSQVEITTAAMAEYYSALDADDSAAEVEGMDWSHWGAAGEPS